MGRQDRDNLRGDENLVSDVILGNMAFASPDGGGQYKIVAIRDTIDHRIGLQSCRRGVQDGLFKSPLRKLMKGEVRAGELDACKRPDAEL